MSISIDRYTLNNPKSIFLSRIAKMKPKFILISEILFSSILCLPKAFEYIINQYGFALDFPSELGITYSKGFWINGHTLIYEDLYAAFLPQRIARIKLILYEISLFITQSINDFVLLLINLFIDVRLWLIVKNKVEKINVS